jgi:hypothetical protein
VPFFDYAERFAGCSANQRIVFEHGVFGQTTAGCDERVLPDYNSVVQRGTVTEKTSITNRVCMADDAMSDGYVIADFSVVIGMKYRIVLNICTGTDLDLARISTNDHSWPNTGSRPDFNVANEISRFRNECGWIDFW